MSEGEGEDGGVGMMLAQGDLRRARARYRPGTATRVAMARMGHGRGAWCYEHTEQLRLIGYQVVAA